MQYLLAFIYIMVLTRPVTMVPLQVPITLFPTYVHNHAIDCFRVIVNVSVITVTFVHRVLTVWNILSQTNRM